VTITGGFGMTFDLSRGGMRQWTMGRDGKQRWTDTAALVGCDDCRGEGEYFTHAENCRDDLCALNGDYHSCAGQVMKCGCLPMEDVFVFGSNLSGVHGKGAALVAATQWGAQRGVGEGLTGRAYALPTKRTPYVKMEMSEVEASVQRFVAHAQSSPEKRFLLTKVGCGLAGFAEDQIAPLFRQAPPNVFLIDERGAVIGPARDWAPQGGNADGK